MPAFCVNIVAQQKPRKDHLDLLVQHCAPSQRFQHNQRMFGHVFYIYNLRDNCSEHHGYYWLCQEGKLVNNLIHVIANKILSMNEASPASHSVYKYCSVICIKCSLSCYYQTFYNVVMTNIILNVSFGGPSLRQLVAMLYSCNTVTIVGIYFAFDKKYKYLPFWLCIYNNSPIL